MKDFQPLSSYVQEFQATDHSKSNPSAYSGTESKIQNPKSKIACVLFETKVKIKLLSLPYE